MEQSFLQKILSKIAVGILVIALLDLFFVNWWILKDQRSNIKDQKEEEVTNVIATEEISEDASLSGSPSPQTSPLSSPASDTTKVVEKTTVVEKQTQTIVQTAQKEIFIPMGTGSTFGNSFSDLSGSDVTIDTNFYPAIDSVVFEASVWVEGGNGRAHARLYNVNDKNPYIESEISNNTGSGVVKTSGKIPIPSGSKTYRVQAKTDITNFAAHVDNARIKIVLK